MSVYLKKTEFFYSRIVKNRLGEMFNRHSVQEMTSKSSENVTFIMKNLSDGKPS